jgi:hypothetical protein
MTDPLMLSVATTVADKAAEAAVEGGKTALAALIRLVRRTLSRNTTHSAALDAALSRPSDPGTAQALAQALEQAVSADPAFGARLREIWPKAQAELSASDGGIVNTVSGTVGGHLIQARDLRVEGGLQIGDVPGPDRPRS